MITFLRNWWRGYSDADMAEASELRERWASGSRCDPGAYVEVSSGVMKAMSELPIYWFPGAGAPPLTIKDGIVEVPD